MHDKNFIRSLKKHAHHLKPVVWVGQNGITEAVLQEVDHALQAHQLIKVKMAGSDKVTRQRASCRICEATGACEVTHIGGILSLYRRNMDLPPIEGATSAVGHTKP